MDIPIDKLVKFEEYCKTCKYRDLTEDKEPCCECLDYPVNEYSHKPVNWKDGNWKGNK